MTKGHWIPSALGAAESLSILDLLLLITGIGAATVIGFGTALRKLSQREASADGRPSARPAPAGDPRIQVAFARRLVSVLGTQLIPAVTAGSLVYVQTGRPREALFVLSAITAGCWLVARFPYPLHLMPAARLLLVVAGPAMGAAFLLLLDPASQLSLGLLIAAAVAATVTAAVGRWTEARFEAERPVATAVIGSSEFATSFAGRLEEAGIRSHRVVGWLSFGSSAPAGVTGDGHLGVLPDVRSLVIEYGVELLVCAPAGNGGSAEGADPDRLAGICHEVTRSCLDLPVRMIDANELYEELLGHVPLASIDAAWFRYIMHPRFSAGSPVFKRLFDLTLALVGGILALPILTLSALAIKLQDGGPILYRQRRIGERGMEFEMLKLRTMHLDSEADGRPRWSSEDDARVTGVGRLLRRAHFDELPQLWNVLRGEMALIGPRPERSELVSRLEQRFPHYERRHLVKPGITGWAQIRCGYAGSEIGTVWKLSHDLYYLKHRSLVSELMLIVETAVAVIRETERLPQIPAEQAQLVPRVSGEQVPI